MTTYGYARVSTNDQDLSSQEAELLAAGCAKVFKEKVSGAKTDRAELAKVLRRLEPGDVLLVTRLDRLARSTRDLLNVLTGRHPGRTANQVRSHHQPHYRQGTWPRNPADPARPRRRGDRMM